MECIFCGQQGQTSREDVIPQWLSRELGGVPPFFAYDTALDGAGQVVSRSRPRTVGSAASLKLREVCRNCNSGWMSRLEERAKPVLLPMIRGVESTLDFGQQRLVAAWCQLKLLTLDAWYLDSYLPAQSLHDFAQSCQPCPPLVVSLGAFAGWSAGVLLPHGWLRLEVPANAEQPPLRIVTVTFAFGSLIVQGTQAERGNGTVEASVPTDNPYLVTVWQPGHVDNVTWPPELAVDWTGFHRLGQTPALTVRST